MGLDSSVWNEILTRLKVGGTVATPWGHENSSWGMVKCEDHLYEYKIPISKTIFPDKTIFLDTGIPIIKIRQSHELMGNPMLVRQHLYIEMTLNGNTIVSSTHYQWRCCSSVNKPSVYYLLGT